MVSRRFQLPPEEESTMQEGKQYLSVKEAAEVLDVGTSMIHNWIRQGRLHTFKAGKLHRISQADLDAFMAEQEPQNPSESRVDEVVGAELIAVLRRFIREEMRS
jgi:excisionase family DNA binding protein